MTLGFKDLIVWNKAMDLTVEIYDIVKLLPKEELFALSDQMRRSVISIPSNIAEGQARQHKKEFVHFLTIAKGSNSELETQLLICIRLGYFTGERAKKALDMTDEINKMLSAMITKLRT